MDFNFRMILGRLELFTILVLFLPSFEKLIMIEIKKSLSETFSIYFDKRMLKILLLGAISGFPGINWCSLSLWLKEDGLSRSTVGWAGLIFVVYAFNIYGHLIDRLNTLFNKKIGHRRGWIVFISY